MRQFCVSFKVVELVKVINVVCFEVKDCQMLQEADIEEFGYFVVADVQLFELFESHNSLHLFKFTSSNVQHSDRFKTGSNISKT